MAKLIAPGKGENDFDNQYSDCAQYGRIQFWDDRYAKETEPFEWYYGYEYFRETIQEYVKKDAKVMVAGCGSSNMLIEMAEDGYQDIVGADISRVVIHQQKTRCRGLPAISFFQGTLCDTDLPEESLDCVIDKALFDSLICTDTGAVTVAQYVTEVERMLKENGVFIIISHGNPEMRLTYLEQYDIDEPHYTPWFIDVQAVVKPKEFDEEEMDPTDPDSLYFIYICTKQPSLVQKKKLKERRLAVQEKKKKGRKKKKAQIL